MNKKKTVKNEKIVKDTEVIGNMYILNNGGIRLDPALNAAIINSIINTNLICFFS